MKQVLQDLKSGELLVEEVPEPTLGPGRLLVANRASLISSGTERATVSVARKGLIGKALERPDQVRKVVEVARREGVRATAQLVRSRLEAPSALGYSSAGVVVGVGEGVDGFAVGDRVACAGQDYASHAERVCVPANLCVPIPDGMSMEQAAFVALGAIALQAVRQAKPEIGDRVAVIGLGLVGLLVVQILRANGCRVVASDPDGRRRKLALELGAEVAVEPAALPSAVEVMTGERGVDRVVVAASTDSDEPVRTAAGVARSRGTVVVVGAVGMDLPRGPFYEKELDFRLSRSYGPGRYDVEYEGKGRDYPFEYVRWTEGRNMEAFLELVAAGSVNLEPLTTHRHDIEDAAAAYERLMTAPEECLGLVLTYPSSQSQSQPPASRVEVAPAPSPTGVRWGIVGAGSHVRDRLLPILAKQPESRFELICTERAGRAKRLARSLKATACTTSFQEVLDDDQVNAVLIGTRHHLHAEQVVRALEAGKHVFVEKPLCLTLEELRQVTRAYHDAATSGVRLRVGFNRRFSLHAVRARDFLGDVSGPIALCCRVNAGPVDARHWTRDEEVGGGRLLGELCHFIDTLQSLVGHRPTAVSAAAVGDDRGGDQGVFQLLFGRRATASIIYATGGDSRLPKERIEAFGGGKALVLDDFRRTDFFHSARKTSVRSRGQDKGFAAELDSFVSEIVGGGDPAMPFGEIEDVTRATILARESLATGEWQHLGE